MININIWSLIFTIINLVVLFLLLKKFLIGPINNIIEQRENMIKDSIDNANQTKADAMKLKQEYEDTLSGVKEECESIRAKSREDAKKEYSRIVDEASEKSSKMISDAERTIKQEREKALGEMESQIADLAMVAAGKIIGENSGVNNQDLYDDFLKKAGEAHDTENC